MITPWKKYPIVDKLTIYGNVYDGFDECIKITNCDEYKCESYNDLKKVLVNDKLKGLYFGDDFNEDISIIKGKFSGLTSLCFGRVFDRDISGLCESFKMVSKLGINGYDYRGFKEYVKILNCDEYKCETYNDLKKVLVNDKLKGLYFGDDFNEDINIIKGRFIGLTS